jgi:Holliday junction DNA helicase RuvB
MAREAARPIYDPQATPEERLTELGLRPRTLEEFVGQERVKENLSVFVEAARRRGDALDHVLLYGPPGLGKTTLAHIIARELEVSIKATSGPVFQNAAELLGVLSALETRQVVFVDEIHRLSRVVEEHLYPAMEDLRCELVVDRGVDARHYTLKLEPFTLIGATTRVGMITPPLRGRFGVVIRLDFYGTEEMRRIVERSAGLLEIPLGPEAAREIAGRSRGTPRIANRLLRRLRDFAQVKGDGRVDLEMARFGLERLGVDAAGLDAMDRLILETVARKFGGGPVGIGSLATAVAEEEETLEDVYEPFLIQEGYLHRTSRGRVATPRAYEHLGLAPPSAGTGQDTLFGS